MRAKHKKFWRQKWPNIMIVVNSSRDELFAFLQKIPFAFLFALNSFSHSFKKFLFVFLPSPNHPLSCSIKELDNLTEKKTRAWLTNLETVCNANLLQRWRQRWSLSPPPSPRGSKETQQSGATAADWARNKESRRSRSTKSTKYLFRSNTYFRVTNLGEVTNFV